MTPTAETIIIGKNMKEIRERRQMSAAQFADRAGMTADAVRKYERGERNLSVLDMLRFSKILLCSEQNFLRGLEDRVQSTTKEIRCLDDYDRGVFQYMATDFRGNPKSTIISLDLFLHMRPERRREVVMEICTQIDRAIEAGELFIDDMMQSKIDYLHACLGYMYDI